MIIYKCVISNDEMFSDSFPLKEANEGIFYEVTGKRVTRAEGFDDSLISANASAEDAAETNEDSSTSGIDIVLNHKLESVTPYNKKDYLKYMKEYVKAIKAHLEATNPGRVEAFVANIPAAVKRITSDIDNFEFFMGESLNEKGMFGLLNYREDGITPYMLFFKDGLIAEKF